MCTCWILVRVLQHGLVLDYVCSISHKNDVSLHDFVGEIFPFESA